MKGNLLLLKDLLKPLKITFVNTWLQYQKNVYIDKLDDTVNKYNNTHHRTIKVKPVDVKPSICTDYIKKMIRKVLNLRLVIKLEYQNIKIFL